jgi:hypothetical protein
MKTKIFYTSGFLMIHGIFLMNTSLNTYAQDDIYYKPSKDNSSDKVLNNVKDTSGKQEMSNYEKYRLMKDGKLKKGDAKSKSDTTLSPEEASGQKSMEQYGNSGGYNDASDQDNSQQSYDSVPQGTTVINNYYSYPDRFGWYRNFYCDYYYDPFYYSYYDPYYWDYGFSWGYPYWGFHYGWYSPWYYSYNPYYYGYGYYGGGYHHGHHDGYYNDYDRDYYHSDGGARRSMGGYRNSSDVRRSSYSGGQTMGYSPNRRSSSYTPVNENGATYQSARRNAYPLYQRTNTNPGNNTTMTSRRVNGNSSINGYHKSIQTTRSITSRRNNSNTYSPSYSTQRNTTRSQYNTTENSGNYGNRRNNSSGTYTRPSDNSSNSGTSYGTSQRRSDNGSSYSGSNSHSNSSGSTTASPSRRSSSNSGSSYSGNSGGSRSSGSSSSGSSGGSRSSGSSSGSSHSSSGHRR